MSVQLAKYGPGVVSDANPALIALYKAVREGWVPPTSVSREEYAAAKLLPDSDPRKAFIGFGCSFGGKWFGGYAKPGQVNKSNGQSWFREPAQQTTKTLRADIPALASCSLSCLSFFDVDPINTPAPECIYADPPYEGTTGYTATAPFDHGRFWAYCQEWASRGVRVFVSEYACPVGASVEWERLHDVTVKGKTEKNARTERLFLVKAPSVARVA